MNLRYLIPSIIVSSALSYGATLATVNGKASTTNDANVFSTKAMGGMPFAKLDTNTKRQVIDQLINQELIKSQVLRSGIQSTPLFKARYEALKADLAVDMWMKQQMLKITVSEKEAKDFYDANKDKMKQGDKQVPFEKAKEEITQFIKVEKFKAQMNKIVANLRSAAEIKVNP